MTWRPVPIIYAAVVTTDERHGQASPCKRFLTYLRKRHAWLCALPMVERMEAQLQATTLRALTTPPRPITTKFPPKNFAGVVFVVTETNNLTGGYRDFHSITKYQTIWWSNLDRKKNPHCEHLQSCIKQYGVKQVVSCSQMHWVAN